jgi:hypothetical protein
MNDKNTLIILNYIENKINDYTKIYNNLTKLYSDTEEENELYEIMLKINHYDSITEELEEVKNFIKNLL